MAINSPIQVGFNGGQFGPRMAARSDVAPYRTGCKTLENFIPTVQGPALKRSGTRFVKAVATESQTSRLIPFEFSRDQAYVLEFADNKIRFMRDEGAVLETAVAISAGTPPTIANPCVITTNAAHGYSTGDEIFISGSRLAFLNSQFFTVAVTGATTFTLSQNGGAAISSVGESLIAAGTNTVARTYQITNGVASNSIPWNHDELDAIQYAQDQDVMYLVHPLYPPHKLVRTSDTSWTCTEVAFEWPPFRDENITDTTVYASAVNGTAVTVQASADIFTADMVGGYIKIGEIIEVEHPEWIPGDDMTKAYTTIGGGDTVYYGPNVYELDGLNGASTTGLMPPTHEEGEEMDRKDNGFEWQFLNRGWGYAKIETFTDANTIVVDVDNWGVRFPASAGVATPTKKWAIGAFSAEMGYPAAVAIFEKRLWLGGTERDPQTFWGSRTNRYDDFELIKADADSGLSFTMAAKKKNAIQWMIDDDILLIGTLGGEVGAFSNSPDEAITPDNIKVRRRSSFGSAPNVSAIQVDSVAMMVHRSGTRVHELLFDINTEKYAGPDLTAMSDDILIDQAKSLSYQAAPFRQVWAHTTDGRLVAMTYVREDTVMGWAEYPIANGVGLSNSAAVESQCIVPHPDGDQDQLWIIAKRTLAGVTRRYIEFMERPFENGDAIADAFFVDAGSTYSGASTSTIYGLLHLAQAVITYLANGVAGTATVSSKGVLIVGSASTKVQAGLPFSAKLETMDFDAGQAPMSTTLGDRGRVVSAVVQVDNTGQGVEIGGSLTGTLDTWTQEGSLYTGKSPLLSVPSGISRDCRLAIRHSTPLPCTIVALMPKLSAEAG